MCLFFLFCKVFAVLTFGCFCSLCVFGLDWGMCVGL